MHELLRVLFVKEVHSWNNYGRARAKIDEIDRRLKLLDYLETALDEIYHRVRRFNDA